MLGTKKQMHISKMVISQRKLQLPALSQDNETEGP